tara:strand:- start:16504 stop:16902 length:399 start_codon:yes stop_codon:yes gene_type:complete
MDFQAALEFATERNAATVIGLQIHGRSIEVYRPRFSHHEGRCNVEYREGLLFQNGYEQSVLKQNQLSGEALSLNYFVAPLSEDELDSALNEEGETLLYRLLDGSPDPQRCINARDKAAFTSWCISALAQRNG